MGHITDLKHGAPTLTILKTPETMESRHGCGLAGNVETVSALTVKFFAPMEVS